MCLRLQNLSLSPEKGLKNYSKKDAEIALNGDIGQGEGLVDSKKKKK